MASYHGTKNLTYDHVGKKSVKTEALKKQLTVKEKRKEAQKRTDKIERYDERGY